MRLLWRPAILAVIGVSFSGLLSVPAMDPDLQRTYQNLSNYGLKSSHLSITKMLQLKVRNTLVAASHRRNLHVESLLQKSRIATPEVVSVPGDISYTAWRRLRSVARCMEDRRSAIRRLSRSVCIALMFSACGSMSIKCPGTKPGQAHLCT